MRSLDFNTRTQVTRWGPPAAPTRGPVETGGLGRGWGALHASRWARGSDAAKGSAADRWAERGEGRWPQLGGRTDSPMTPGEAGGCCRSLGLVVPRAVGRGGSWEGAGVCSGNAAGLGACREAINRLYEAVPGVKGIWKKKVSLLPGPSFSARPGPGLRAGCWAAGSDRSAEPGVSRAPPLPPPPREAWSWGAALPPPSSPPQAPNKALFSILGKSNLRFAGMSIAVNISVDGLNLMIPTTRQVRAGHRGRGLRPHPSPLPPASAPAARRGQAAPPSNPTAAVPTDHCQPPHAVHLLRLRRGHGEALLPQPPSAPCLGSGDMGLP